MESDARDGVVEMSVLDYLTDAERKAYAASPLLPEPGPEVVREHIQTIAELRHEAVKAGTDLNQAIVERDMAKRDRDKAEARADAKVKALKLTEGDLFVITGEFDGLTLEDIGERLDGYNVTGVALKPGQTIETIDREHAKLLLEGIVNRHPV